MPKRRKKKKNEYYIHLEPIVECMQCGHDHLYRQRRRVKCPDDPRFLTVSVCPKCKKEGYVMYGDKEVRRIKKDEVEEPRVEMEQVVVIETNTGGSFDASEFSLYTIPENKLGQFKKEHMPSFISLITGRKTSLKELLSIASKEFKQEKYWKPLGLEMGIPGNVRAGSITKVRNINDDYVSIPVSSISEIKKVRKVKK